MSQGCRQIQNLNVEGVPLLIKRVWIDRSQDVAIMFGLGWIHDPDRAGTLAHQVHSCPAKQSFLQASPTFGGYHHQVIPAPQYLTDDLNEWRS